MAQRGRQMGKGGDDDEEEMMEEEVQLRVPPAHKLGDRSLMNQPWYWPHITRGEAERKMAGQPDGSFLIRDCSVPGDFTLTVRKDGCCKCIHIYKQGNDYSLVSTGTGTKFACLADLVEFYKTHSLVAFNKHFSVCLETPVRKSTVEIRNQYSVFQELYEVSQQKQHTQNSLDYLRLRHEQLCSKVKLLELMIPGMLQVQTMYWDQLQLQADWVEPLLSKEPGNEVRVARMRWLQWDRSLQENNHVTSPNPSICLSEAEEKRLVEGKGLLVSRHQAMIHKVDSIKCRLHKLQHALRQLEAELKQQELTLVNIQNTRHELVSQLVVMGYREDYVCRVMEPPEECREFHRATWLMKCSREEAASRLKDLPHGAFLVRHKDDICLPFILSIMVCKRDGQPPVMCHCCIVRPHRRKLGFNAATAVFESIEQLVLRHRYVSLKNYFSHLDVTLAFPVGCQQMLQRL